MGYLCLSGFHYISLIVIIISWGIHLNREIEVNYSHRNY